MADLVRAILPCLQDLSRAIESARTEASGGALVNGLELVKRGFADALAAVGVSEIDPIGQPFDAERMEAIGQAPSEEVPEGHVVLVVQRGFQFDDRLIRPAQVLLSAGRATPGDAPPADPPEDPS
jgi:molecular chaperone GrpE